jgi:hypothetical protein
VFYGDLYGCEGENPQPAVNQLSDLIRARKLFAYGDLRDYWDHREFKGLVSQALCEKAEVKFGADFDEGWQRTAWDGSELDLKVTVAAL